VDSVGVRQANRLKQLGTGFCLLVLKVQIKLLSHQKMPVLWQKRLTF
jgi:hypothetical protein